MTFSAPRFSPTQRTMFVAFFVFIAIVTSLGMAVVALPARVAYEVGDGELRVDAWVGPVPMGRSAPLADVEGAERTTLSQVSRRAGTARGDFCHGKWHVEALGNVWMAGTCGPDAVVVRVAGEPWVLTPADPAAFVAGLQSGSGSFPAAQGQRSAWLDFLWVFVLVPLGIVLGLAWKLSQDMEYKLEGNVLVVPAHFSPVRLSLAGARFRRGSLGWKTWRTAGTGMPGLLLGNFRTEGRKLHVAARGRENGVFVVNQQEVFVTPESVDDFCAALVNAGAREEP